MKFLGNEMDTYGVAWPELLREFLLAGFWCGVAVVLLSVLEVQIYYVTLILGALWLGVFIWMARRLSQQPVIVLYENGVGLRQKDTEQNWHWTDITRWDGQRTTHSYNGIPTIRHGANHFYAGEQRIFSVDAHRERADQLANYIFSKMAQYSWLPRDLSNFDAEMDVQYDGVIGGKSGLIGRKQTVLWQEIEKVDFREDHLRVKRHSDRRLRNFGYVSPVASYRLMGLLDRQLKTDLLARKQAELSASRGKIWRAQGKMLARLTLVVSPLIILVIVFLLMSDQSGKERYAGLRELTAQFGSKVAISCAPQMYGRYEFGVPTATAPHYLIVDATDDQNPKMHQAFQSALTEAEQAASAADVTTVVCLWETTYSVGKCRYEVDGEIVRYERIRRDYFIGVFEYSDEVILSEGALIGPFPAICPDENPGGPIYGELPGTLELLNWLHDGGGREEPLL